MRRRYLVAYDIREDKRLRAIASCMEGFGDRLQYSVFICDLSQQELITMRAKLEVIMNMVVDSVMVIDLGKPENEGMFLFLGKRMPLPKNRAAII